MLTPTSLSNAFLYFGMELKRSQGDFLGGRNWSIMGELRVREEIVEVKYSTEQQEVKRASEMEVERERETG